MTPSPPSARRRSRGGPPARAPKVNDLVEIWWKDDKKYYRGRLKDRCPDNTFRVLYNDDEEEHLNLTNERWRFVSNPANVHFPLGNPRNVEEHILDGSHQQQQQEEEEGGGAHRVVDKLKLKLKPKTKTKTKTKTNTDNTPTVPVASTPASLPNSPNPSAPVSKVAQNPPSAKRHTKRDPKRPPKTKHIQIVKNQKQPTPLNSTKPKTTTVPSNTTPNTTPNTTHPTRSSPRSAPPPSRMDSSSQSVKDDEARRYLTHSRDNRRPTPTATATATTKQHDSRDVPSTRDDSPPSVRGPIPRPSAKKKKKKRSRTDMQQGQQVQEQNPTSAKKTRHAPLTKPSVAQQPVTQQPVTQQPVTPQPVTQPAAPPLTTAQPQPRTNQSHLATLLSKKLRPLERQIHELGETINALQDTHSRRQDSVAALTRSLDSFTHTFTVEMARIMAAVSQSANDMRAGQADIVQLLRQQSRNDRLPARSPPSKSPPMTAPTRPVVLSSARPNPQPLSSAPRPTNHKSTRTSPRTARPHTVPNTSPRPVCVATTKMQPVEYKTYQRPKSTRPQHTRHSRSTRLEDTYEDEFSAGGNPSLSLSPFQTRVSNLVARQITVWVLETPHELDANSKMTMLDWANKTTVIAFRHVADRLSHFETYTQAYQTLSTSLGKDAVDLGWFSNPGDESMIEVARRNYCAWDPPPSNTEWHAEQVLLRKIAETFQTALVKYCVSNEPDLAAAVAIAKAAAEVLVDAGYQPVSAVMQNGSGHSQVAHSVNSSLAQKGRQAFISHSLR